MTTITYPATVIPELTDSQIQEIIKSLDTGLNNTILTALLHVHLCDCLYFQWALCVANFTAIAWKSVWEIYTLIDNSTPVTLTGGVIAILSTVLADATMAWDLIPFIWRCWIVWGWEWRVVLIPIACTALATASRGIVAYYDTVGPLVSPQAFLLENEVNWALLYASLMMATVLWCTILIIYRILRVGGASGRIHVFQRVIEILVESALLYSAVMVILLVFEARNEIAAYYIEVLAVAMRGIIPTMQVGRVAAGHARPDDCWSESRPGSSIRFENHSTLQNDTRFSVESVRDTSSTERPNLEQGLEDVAEARVEGPAPIDSADDYNHVVGKSSSVDYSIV
ncbi:hypothetical protein EDD18DRAFT_1113130 [Armillaria luteobubalina]|uniref:Uncharacterized protein n=1 Tax=Armillaria luteobubalina TaxID=153913 RepID=A0AA39TD50_9AGAR|nr:hypothetical protein EDD18DRAFT_1113130 [Armillaria luteobubalina]